MWENLPTVMVGMRILVAIGIFILLAYGNSRGKILAFAFISLCILLDLSDGGLQRAFDLKPPYMDGIGDGAYILAGFLGIYRGGVRNRKRLKEMGVTAGAKLDLRDVVIMGLVWITLTILAYSGWGIFQEIGMAFLHIYYVGAAIWLWYYVGAYNLLYKPSKYLPAIAITLAIIVATWDHSRLVDFISGRP